MFGAITKIRAAIAAGDYEEAGRLFYVLLGDLTGWGGRSAADCEPECVAAFEGLIDDCQGRAAGGAIVLALIQAFGPFLLELLKRRIADRPTA